MSHSDLKVDTFEQSTEIITIKNILKYKTYLEIQRGFRIRNPQEKSNFRNNSSS